MRSGCVICLNSILYLDLSDRCPASSRRTLPPLEAKFKGDPLKRLWVKNESEELVPVLWVQTNCEKCLFCKAANIYVYVVVCMCSVCVCVCWTFIITNVDCNNVYLVRPMEPISEFVSLVNSPLRGLMKYETSSVSPSFMFNQVSVMFRTKVLPLCTYF